MHITLMGIVKFLASLLGWLVILIPVIQTIRLSTRGRGPSTGHGMKYRSWQFVVLMAAGFIAIGVALWVPLPLSIPPVVSATLFWMGAVIYFGGVGMYLWGFFTLKSLFGVSSYAGAQLYRGHELITSGPFRVVRHPMYLGVLLAALGGTLIFRTWSMLVFLPMSLVVIKRAAHEESLLEEAFEEQWREYASRTPRWIPHLFSRKPKWRRPD